MIDVDNPLAGPAVIARRRDDEIGISVPIHVSRAIQRGYGPILDRCIRRRYLTVACGVALLLLAGGYVASGRIGLILMPRVESDYAYVSATLPVGSAFERAAAVRDRLEDAARDVAAENGGEKLFEGVFALVNENTVEVFAYLTDAEVRLADMTPTPTTLA